MTIELIKDSSVSNFAVFGNPVKHSQSPNIHFLFAEQCRIQLCYQAIEIPEDKFNDYVYAFAQQSGKGINITVPFKEQANRICHTLTDRARNAGSVNTVWFDEDMTIHGDTTDGQGLINDLTINNSINIKDKSVLILGAGGSVKAIVEPLCEQLPERIVIANRTLSKAEQLVEKKLSKVMMSACEYNELTNDSFDLIINGTSLSLTGDLPPIPETVIKETSSCYDLMYSDKQTVFIQWAAKQGAEKVMDGLGMLVEQAAEGFYIWHGVRPDTAAVIKSLRKVKSEK